MRPESIQARKKTLGGAQRSPLKVPLGIRFWPIFLSLAGLAGCASEPPDPIRVGIVHSLTGTMAVSETPVAQATQLAIDEINGEGGLVGRQIEAIWVDPRSEPRAFGEAARHLLEERGVSAIFGGWTSASRKEMKPIVEAADGVLFYSVQYEGMEISDHIVYLGATPNQQMIPALQWFFDNKGSRFFLVGSDYIYPRSANAVARDFLESLGATVVGEAYLPLGGREVSGVIRQIETSGADVIVNTINGDSNQAFFRGLRAAGIFPEQLPAVSFSLSEVEVAQFGVELFRGDYAAWNYFHGEERAANRVFIERYRAVHGADSVINDPMVAAYGAVHLWADAARRAGTPEASAVRAELEDGRFDGPQGRIYMDADSLHTWKPAKLARISDTGSFDPIWQSEAIIHPVRFPRTRARREWNALVEGFYAEWGNAWVNPAGIPGEERGS